MLLKIVLSLNDQNYNELHGRCLIRGRNCLPFGEHLGSHLVFGGVCIAHLFSFLCCDFCFVCLRPVSCVPLLPVSLDCPFLIASSVFSNIYFIFWGWENKPLIKTLIYGEQMIQGLPIQAKYQHHWHLYISKCSAYNSFKVYYYVFIFDIYSFKIEK